MISVAMFAAVTVIPQALYGLGYGPTSTGLLMAPTAVLMVLAAPLTARFAARTGSRATFQAGAVLATAGLGLLGFAHRHPWQFCLAGAASAPRTDSRSPPSAHS